MQAQMQQEGFHTVQHLAHADQTYSLGAMQHPTGASSAPSSAIPNDQQTFEGGGTCAYSFSYLSDICIFVVYGSPVRLIPDEIACERSPSTVGRTRALWPV
jgi:hypothetical protein